MWKPKKYGGPFGYDPNIDAIRYNPDRPLLSGVDKDGIMVHELAPRSNTPLYHTTESKLWANAIQTVEQAILGNVTVVRKWFDIGGKYEENAFFSDIISALSKGEISTLYGHDKNYWSKPGYREREIFANMAALDVLFGCDGMPKEEVFGVLYEAFEKIVSGGH